MADFDLASSVTIVMDVFAISATAVYTWLMSDIIKELWYQKKMKWRQKHGHQTEDRTPNSETFIERP